MVANLIDAEEIDQALEQIDQNINDINDFQTRLESLKLKIQKYIR